MATTCLNTELVGYPVRSIVLNVSARRKPCLIGSVHMMVRYQAERFIREQLKLERSRNIEQASVYGLISLRTLPLESCVQLTADCARERTNDDVTSISYKGSNKNSA